MVILNLFIKGCFFSRITKYLIKGFLLKPENRCDDLYRKWWQMRRYLEWHCIPHRPFVFCESCMLQTKRFVLNSLKYVFPNIKHKGKTLTASTVNKSLPWERKQQTGEGWHACWRNLTHHFFFYLHKLPFAAAVRILSPPLVSTTRYSGTVSRHLLICL